MKKEIINTASRLEQMFNSEQAIADSIKFFNHHKPTNVLFNYLCECEHLSVKMASAYVSTLADMFPNIVCCVLGTRVQSLTKLQSVYALFNESQKTAHKYPLVILGYKSPCCNEDIEDLKIEFNKKKPVLIELPGDYDMPTMNTQLRYLEVFLHKGCLMIISKGSGAYDIQKMYGSEIHDSVHVTVDKMDYDSDSRIDIYKGILAQY